MNSILERIKQFSDAGDEDAQRIRRETYNMSDKELALYLGDDAHAAEVAKLLGVQHLVTKDANQALAKDFYELRNRGRQMMNPDRGQMLDVYNEKLKDVPYYMEKFGLPTEQGKYRVEDQIKFVKNIDKLDPVELQNLANQEGFATADQMRNEIKRTGDRLIGDIARKGLDPETGGTTLKSVLRSAASLAAPRIVEAQEMGQDPSWKDVVGDEVEMGLNFVPGMSAVSKGARALSKFNRFKNLPNSVATRIASGAAEMGTAPFGSQVYDYAAYDKDDPRGKWDWARVGAQSAGGLAGFGMVKGIGAQGKNLLEGTSGKAGGNQTAKNLMDVIDNIGSDATENIARRQLVMERKAELATDPRYNSDKFLTASQNKTGHFATVEDLADAEDFAIKKAEAERFANTQTARQKYENQLKSGGNPDMSAPELNNYGDYETIMQLPDGRFVSEKTMFGTPENPAIKGRIYADDYNDGIDASQFSVLRNNEGIPDEAWTDQVVENPGFEDIKVSYKPRDYTVRRELAKDPDFDAVASGRAAKQPLYNTAAYAGFNAAAREGIVGEGLGMDDKRESALWNRQLDQLRPLVQQGEPEYKRQMVDAIMNVMTYGAELPETLYQQNRNAYDAIAQRLGIRYNNSVVSVPDYPTTSYSSAR